MRREICNYYNEIKNKLIDDNIIDRYSEKLVI